MAAQRECRWIGEIMFSLTALHQNLKESLKNDMASAFHTNSKQRLQRHTFNMEHGTKREDL